MDFGGLNTSFFQLFLSFQNLPFRMGNMEESGINRDVLPDRNFFVVCRRLHALEERNENPIGGKILED